MNKSIIGMNVLFVLLFITGIFETLNEGHSWLWFIPTTLIVVWFNLKELEKTR